MNSSEALEGDVSVSGHTAGRTERKPQFQAVGTKDSLHLLLPVTCYLVSEVDSADCASAALRLQCLEVTEVQ